MAEGRRKVKDKRERERNIQQNAEFQRIARKEKKALLNEQCKKIKKKIEESNRMGKNRNIFKKIIDT